MPPSQGTVSARIWEIADAHSRQGAPANRAEVVAEAIALGIHAKTASTQFGAWKRHTHPELSGIRQKSLQPLQATASLQQQLEQPDRHWASLLKNGFTYSADWIVSTSGGIELDRQAPFEPGVYVFVEADQVVYIGTTRRRLSDRMADYRRGHAGQRTSARVRGLLLESLKKGYLLRVLFASPGETEWNGLPVEISAGLEAGLIARFKPIWNHKGL
jgi:hypothetical protein